MKRKNIKLLCFFVIGIPSLIIAPILLIKSNTTNVYNLSNESIIKDPSLYAIPNGEEAPTTFTFREVNLISWANKKYANDVTPSDLEELLISSSPSANFSIFINQPSEVDIQNGVVKFTIKQQLKIYQDGITIPGKEVTINPSAGQGTNGIWETPANLVLPKKFRFRWADNKTIESFILATNKRFNELTKSDVLDNLIDFSSIIPNNTNNINVTFSDMNNITNSGSLYGVGNIQINFTNTTATDWVGNTLPTQDERTLTVRGLTNTSNNRSIMELSINPLINIGNNSLDAAGKIKFANELLSSNLNPQFNNLFASQFLPPETSAGEQELIDMLFSGLYSTNKEPVVLISYLGININNPNFSTLTGIPSNIVDQVKVTKIQPSINDLTGSLSILYTYNVYDIFSHSIVSKNSIQNFPNGTFRPNVDAGKNLLFKWKDKNVISSNNSIGTSFNVVNNYKQNINDDLYLMNLSNYFIAESNDSTDVYNQPRKVVIDYLGGGSDSPEGYVPLNPNESQIVVQLLFHTWNGKKYIEKNTNIEKYGLFAEGLFDLGVYNYLDTTETVRWKSNNDLINQIPRLSSELPSSIAYEIFKPSKDKFVTSDDFYIYSPGQGEPDIGIQSIFYPDDVNGTIEIRIYSQKLSDPIGSGRIYTQFYSGFKKSDSNSSIVEFAWIPQIDINSKLLNQRIENVTKQQVIDDYLKLIPLFANQTLGEDNVTLNIDINNPNILIVTVTIPLFNQDQSSPGNQTFATAISGFDNFASNNIAEFSAPDNFTMIIGISGATFIVVLLTVIIVFILLKTFYVKKIQKINRPKRKIGDKRSN